MREEDRHVGTVLRTLEILECFKLKKSELTLAELSSVSGLNQSRLLRICGTLQFKGYLHRDEETRKFSLGPRLMVLGRIYEQANTLYQLSESTLKRLAEETKETASLFVLYGTKRLCLVKVDGELPIRYVSVEGDILDLHRGVGGKVLLSFMADDEREDILGKLIDEAQASLTREGAETLRSELLEIRKAGYIVSFEDVIPEVGSMSAPVFDHRGKCCASIAIAGPVHRFSSDRSPFLVEKLLAAAARLSERLGYVREPDD